MIDATPEITAALRAHLMADPVLFAAIGDRVSTDWGLKLSPPFIRLRVPDVAEFEDDCAGKGSEHRALVFVFTRERGGSQRGQLVDRVRRALDDATLTLATSSAWWCQFSGSMAYTDPDDPELQIARLAYSIPSTDGA